MRGNRDIYEVPRCPSGHCLGEGSDSRCPMGRHERIYAKGDAIGETLFRFESIVWFLRNSGDAPLTFMQFAGVALMVNSERRSMGPVPLNWFENCSTCGAGSEGCECDPNILAILAREEGGSEWQ